MGLLVKQELVSEGEDQWDVCYVHVLCAF
jgi:hypothetical protein